MKDETNLNNGNNELSAEESKALVDFKIDLGGTGQNGSDTALQLLYDERQVQGQREDFKKIIGKDLFQATILIWLILSVWSQVFEGPGNYKPNPRISMTSAPPLPEDPGNATPAILDSTETSTGILMQHRKRRRSLPEIKYNDPGKNKLQEIITSTSESSIIKNTTLIPDTPDLITKDVSFNNNSSNKLIDDNSIVINNTNSNKEIETNNSALNYLNKTDEITQVETIKINSFRGKNISLVNACIHDYFKSNLEIKKKMVLFIVLSDLSHSFNESTLNKIDHNITDHALEIINKNQPLPTLYFRIGKDDSWKTYSPDQPTIIANKDGQLEFMIKRDMKNKKEIKHNYFLSFSVSEFIQEK